jgi:hypothetical protein
MQASRLYFAEHNVEGMLEVLRPMHELMQKGPETLREITFQQQLGRDLQEAQDWCERYKQSRQEKDLQQVSFTFKCGYTCRDIASKCGYTCRDIAFKCKYTSTYWVVVQAK